jgi:PIN domain nuclease of toxin-antitoxin system
VPASSRRRLGIEPGDVLVARAEDDRLVFESRRPLGLSLADRACLAPARRLGVPAVMADRTWLDFAPGLGIDVGSIR